MQWRTARLPAHLDAFLNSEFGKKPENARTKLSPQIKRDMVSRLTTSQVQTLLSLSSRRVMVSQTAFFMVEFNSALAATQLDTLVARGKLKPAVRQQLFDAINHPNPLVGRSLIETLLLEPDNFWLAEYILDQNWKTFEAINKAWNDSMRENAEASKHQAEQNAVEEQEQKQAAQSAATLDSEEKQAEARQQAQAQAFQRIQQKNAQRHRSTMERPVTSDVAATPSASSAVGTAPAGVEMETVKSTQNGIPVITHRYVPLPGGRAAHMMPEKAGPAAAADFMAQKGVVTLPGRTAQVADLDAQKTADLLTIGNAVVPHALVTYALFTQMAAYAQRGAFAALAAPSSGTGGVSIGNPTRRGVLAR